MNFTGKQKLIIFGPFFAILFGAAVSSLSPETTFAEAMGHALIWAPLTAIALGFMAHVRNLAVANTKRRPVESLRRNLLIVLGCVGACLLAPYLFGIPAAQEISQVLGVFFAIVGIGTAFTDYFSPPK